MCWCLGTHGNPELGRPCTGLVFVSVALGVMGRRVIRLKLGGIPQYQAHGGKAVVLHLIFTHEPFDDPVFK